jgi:hypothetical protein
MGMNKEMDGWMDGWMDLSAEAAKPLKYAYTARINYLPGGGLEAANSRSKSL